MKPPSPLLEAMWEKRGPYNGTTIQHTPCSIYRVPPNLREGNPSAYEPQIVSIGPHHHGNLRLQAMEEHKWRYLYNLLARRSQGNRDEEKKILEACIEKVKGEEARARGYYSEPVGLGSDDFTKMMVLDGCFMLQLLLRFCGKDESLGDPLFEARWIPNVMRRDVLLMLENQIPFFILQELFDLVLGRSGATLMELAFHFVTANDPQETMSNRLGNREIYHLLHLHDMVLKPTTKTAGASSANARSSTPSVRCLCSSSCILPTAGTSPPTNNEASKHMVPTVVELRRAGVRFRKKATSTELDRLNVTFEDGTLEIPTLAVDDDTNAVFRNLIAFEQCFPGSDGHFTAYAVFLDCLVNTQADVAYLKEHEIIRNDLGSDEEVARLVNQLGKDVCYDDEGHFLATMFQEVNAYCESRWHRLRADFRRTYCSSPWKSISIAVGAAILVLTALQAVYSALSYHKK